MRIECASNAHSMSSVDRPSAAQYVPSVTSPWNRTYIQPQPEDGMWAGLQDRIDDRFTPWFDAEKNCKNLYELFIDRTTILI